MEKIENLIEDLQSQFEEFKNKYENDLYSFIWYADNAEFVLDEKADTFYFSPKEKKVWIPLKWFIEYLALSKSSDKSEQLELQKLNWKFWLAHEFSHFRDMMKEQEVSGESSMYRVLKKLSWQKIKLSDELVIPIGNMIHDIYNSIDDIIVNYEVMNFVNFGIDKNAVRELYQKVNFADYDTQSDWTKTLNLDHAVDYSQIPDYTALAYYFLRKKMVPDQPIMLSENLQKILFDKNQRNIPWSATIKQLKKLFEDEVELAKNSTDPKVKKRYEKLVMALNTNARDLSVLVNDWIKINNKLLTLAINQLTTYDTSRISAASISLDNIINLFTVNKWWDDGHILCISPDLRYKIYEAIFDPIIRTLILIYCLHNDIKDWFWYGKWKNGEDWEWQDKSEWEWKEEWEGEWESECEWDNEKWSYSRSLEDALKSIEEAQEYGEEKRKQKQRKEQTDKVWQSILDLLKDKWVSKEDYEFKNEVQSNFLPYIEEITKILYDELYSLDIQQDTANIISKKWNLNYDEFTKQIPDSILDGDFSKKSIYERRKHIETIKEEFKKLAFYFMIDVSGSTDRFKWKKWLLNWVPLSLALAIKNVERAIQNLSGDMSYTIPVKFIIYTNSVNHFTTDEDLKDFDTEVIKVNSAIAKVSGWTDDRQWWKMAWQSLSSDFVNHPEYIEEIKQWKLKPVVLQIADSDVSEDWVEWLRKEIEKQFWEEIEKALMPKRIILWEEIDVERTEEELAKMSEDPSNKRWNRSPEYVRLPDGTIKADERGRKMVRVKEIWVRSKTEIIKWIRALFQNFFVDVIKS